MKTWQLKIEIRILQKIAKATFCVICIAFPSTMLAQNLQTLFTTAEQRQILDEGRTVLDEVELQIMEEEQVEILELEDSEPEATLSAVEIFYELKGIVRRGDNEFTVWLNDKIFTTEELPANVEIVSTDAGFGLQISEGITDRSYLLMPGQILNLGSGELVERYHFVEPVQIEPEELIEENFAEEPVPATEETNEADLTVNRNWEFMGLFESENVGKS